MIQLSDIVIDTWTDSDSIVLIGHQYNVLFYRWWFYRFIEACALAGWLPVSSQRILNSSYKFNAPQALLGVTALGQQIVQHITPHKTFNLSLLYFLYIIHKHLVSLTYVFFFYILIQLYKLFLVFVLSYANNNTPSSSIMLKKTFFSQKYSIKHVLDRMPFTSAT